MRSLHRVQDREAASIGPNAEAAWNLFGKAVAEALKEGAMPPRLGGRKYDLGDALCAIWMALIPRSPEQLRCVTLLAGEEGDARHHQVGRKGERKVELRAFAGRQDHVATKVERCIGAAAVGIEAAGIATGVAAVPR